MKNAMLPKSPPRLIVKRTCIFLLVNYSVLIALWVAGNAQSFLDSTQAFLLQLLSLDSIILCLLSLVGILFILIFPVRLAQPSSTAIRSGLGIAGYILLFALGIAGALFGGSVLTLAAGLH